MDNLSFKSFLKYLLVSIDVALIVGAITTQDILIASSAFFFFVISVLIFVIPDKSTWLTTQSKIMLADMAMTGKPTIKQGSDSEPYFNHSYAGGRVFYGTDFEKRESIDKMGAVVTKLETPIQSEKRTAFLDGMERLELRKFVKLDDYTYIITSTGKIRGRKLKAFASPKVIAWCSKHPSPRS